MSLLYFLERAKLCQLLLKSQMPSESPIEPIMLNKFLYNIEYSSKTLKENANRLQKKTRRNIQFNTFFSSERKSIDYYTNCCISSKGELRPFFGSQHAPRTSRFRRAPTYLRISNLKLSHFAPPPFVS